MGYYPVALQMTDRAVVVVGGGAVAARKVDALLAAGARVTVVAPALAPSLAGLAAEGRITHVQRNYRGGDVEGHALTFVAVDDPAVSRRVAEEARARGVWVNVADDAEHCDFLLPSVLRRGELVVAVSTGGASPALARAVRERLEAVVGEDDGRLAAVAARVRRDLRGGPSSPDAAAWRRALEDDELRRLLRAGRDAEAGSRLRHRLMGA